jgi:hypothetical protein
VRGSDSLTRLVGCLSGHTPAAVQRPTARSREMARKDAAFVFKVGEQSVQNAKALLEHAPDLAAEVEACRLSLAAAYEQHKERLKEREQRDNDAARIATYAEAISNGEMTFEEAMEIVLIPRSWPS